MNKKKLKNTLLAGPYLIWIIGFILIPLMFVVYYGLTDGEGEFTLDNVRAITEPIYYEALFLSLDLALVCTIVCFLLAFPLALILRNMNISKKGFIVFLFILPMWMNFLLRTYAWQAILDINGVLDTFLDFFGIKGVSIINTPAAIVLGMVYDYLPFMVLPIYNIMVKIDDNVINAARDLGASYWQTLRKIILPLSMPGIVSGVIMVFVPSLTTFAISDILGGGKMLLIGNIIESKVKRAGNMNLGAGLSLILMVFIVINMLFQARYSKGEDKSSLI